MKIVWTLSFLENSRFVPFILPGLRLLLYTNTRNENIGSFVVAEKILYNDIIWAETDDKVAVEYDREDQSGIQKKKKKIRNESNSIRMEWDGYAFLKFGRA